MDLIALDIESFWSDTYSLSKMTPLEYVYGPEFEIIGVTLLTNGENPQTFSGTKEETRDFLITAGVTESAVIAHNLSEFDAVVLGWLGVRPKQYICTLQMARGIGIADTAGGSLAALARAFGLPEKGTEVHNVKGKHRRDFTPAELQRYMDYCTHDTWLCWQIFTKMASQIPSQEWGVMSLTTRMVAEPSFRIDEPLLREYAAELARKEVDALAELEQEHNITRDMLMSNPQLACLLEGLGVDVPTKISARTGKLTFAFAKSDAGFRELLEHDDPLVSTIAHARLGVKSTIEATRTARFLGVSAMTGGWMPVPLRYCGAHTGRWSGAMKLNMQNLSARKREPVLKRSLQAPPGYVVCSADSKQIEARVLAVLAGETSLIQSFAEGADTYRNFAARHVFHCALDAVTPTQRQIAKSAVLGCGFGMGDARFRDYIRIETGMVISPEESQQVVQAYRGAHPRIKALWRRAMAMLEDMASSRPSNFHIDALGVVHAWGALKAIGLPSGRFLWYPGLTVDQDANFYYERRRGRKSQKVFLHGGLVTENFVQAIARDIIAHQALLVDRRYRVISLTHDEIVCLIPTAEAEDGVKWVVQQMRQLPSWANGWPIDAEASYAANYGDA